MKTRKLLFVLPNLLTVCSIFCGFFALTLCMGAPQSGQFFHAALAILAAFFFDGFDGRVARMTRTQSQFGMELDSLADVISFGVAPAVLVYRWALEPFGIFGVAIAFLFTACGALRLARFNVIASRSPAGGSASHFVGLPIPLAASMIISMVIAQHVTSGGGPLSPDTHAALAAVTVVLSLLMVSTVRYRTFKHLKVSRATVSAAAFVLGGGVLVATRFHPAYVLLALFSAYLVFGLLESSVSVTRKLVLAKSEARIAPAEQSEQRSGDGASH